MAIATVAKRVILFLVTNLLIMVMVGIVFNVLASVFGLPPQIHGSLGSLLLFSGVVGFAGSFISLLMSKQMAKWMMGVKIIDPATHDHELKRLVQMVHDSARRAKLAKMPEVGIYESPDLNAFATGPSKSNSLVAVTTGLMRRMSADELEGVIGHEVAHIANGDMVTMTLIQGIVNTFVVFFSRLLANVVSGSVDEKYRGLVYFGTSILFDIVFGILGSIVVAIYSRRREFRADLGSARLVGKPKMIAALRALQNSTIEPVVEERAAAFASLRIDSKPGGLMALLSTHPPLEMRIQTLEKARI